MPPPSWPDLAPQDVSWVLTPGDLDRMLARVEAVAGLDDGAAVLDLETSSLDEHAPGSRIVSAALTLSRHGDPRRTENYAIGLSHPDGPFCGRWGWVAAKLAAVLRGTEIPISGQNIRFDLRWLYRHTGVDLVPQISWDTQLSSHLLDENSSASLKPRAQATFGVPRWDDFDFSRAAIEQRAELVKIAKGRPPKVPDYDWQALCDRSRRLLGERADFFDFLLYNVHDTYWTWALEVRHRELLGLGDSPLDPSVREDRQAGRLGRFALRVGMPMVRTITTMEQVGWLLDAEWTRDRLAVAEVAAGERYAELEALLPGAPEDFEEEFPSPRSYEPTSKWFAKWAELMLRQNQLRVAAATPQGRPSWTKSVLVRQDRAGSVAAGALLAWRRSTKEAQFLRSWLEKVSADGRIHSTYSYARVITGRTSSSEPNMQQVTKLLRPAFIASPGYVLIDADLSQIEMRTAAHMSNCAPMIEAFRRGDDLHRLMAASITGKRLEDITPEERQHAKACIAEGQLVLTARGPVPIESVTECDLVWDGVEWVTQAGPVYQGEREVLTYDGLTATPDHIVILEDGREVCFGYAASSMDAGRLAVGAVGATPARVPFLGRLDADGGYVSRRRRDVLALREDRRQARGQPPERYRARLQVPAESEVSRPAGRCARGAVRRDLAAMQAKKQHESELRGSRDRATLRQSGALHTLGASEPAARDLPRGAARPEGQRRTLRAGESSVSDTTSEPMQQAQHHRCAVHGHAGCPNSRSGFNQDRLSRLPIQSKLDLEFAPTGAPPGGDHSTDPQWARAKVYDLLEAGPRHRYVVSGRVVLNCNFGLMFLMGPGGLQAYAEDTYDVVMTAEQAQAGYDAYFALWTGLADWHARQVLDAERHGYVVSPLGRVRRFPDGASNDYERGAMGRQAVNSPVQSMASDILQIGAAKVLREVPGVRLLGMIHDSVVAEVPEDDAERAGREIHRCLTRLDPELLALGCRLAVPLEAEVKISSRWGEDAATEVAG